MAEVARLSVDDGYLADQRVMSTLSCEVEYPPCRRAHRSRDCVSVCVSA